MRSCDILPMAEEHLDQVAEIEKQCFSDPWSRRMLSEHLANPCAAALVAMGVALTAVFLLFGRQLLGAFGASPEMAAKVTKAVKAVAKKPVYMKLSPNAADIAEVARACEEAGADGVCLINTLLGMRIDPRTRRPILANTFGGLSGPCVLPVALRMVWQVYEAVNIPIIGMGGVASAADVLEMMLAGATAVEVGAANLKNPYACRDIVRALPAEMARCGIENLTDIIGGAHHG